MDCIKIGSYVGIIGMAVLLSPIAIAVPAFGVILAFAIFALAQTLS